jgi:rSAM/selenodomain-associated transferase 1
MRIAVFAKAPVAGAVKTRLAGVLGAEGAARLHADLVRHALRIAVRAKLGRVELWCAPDERHPFFARCADELGVILKPQGEGDLGARMARAFAASGARADPLLVIGADCPALDIATLLAAASALRSRDAVFAPAEDGGYVLVGLARPLPRIFEGIDWGTSGVMAQTRERLAECGASCHELPVMWDVDRPEDYARLQDSSLAWRATA